MSSHSDDHPHAHAAAKLASTALCVMVFLPGLVLVALVFGFWMFVGHNSLNGR